MEASDGKNSGNSSSGSHSGKSNHLSWYDKIYNWGKDAYQYCTVSVWSDTRRKWWIDILKILNLAVRSFSKRGLQNRAAALTYQTMLAIVPALALIFAICRGFGFQNLVSSQLSSSFSAQAEALHTAMGFVDSYLAQTSEGVFVGIGIIFLLWTLISLISNVEDAFNKIWGVEHGRTFWRKITDYTAIFLILPILMICASGITVFMSSTLQNVIKLPFLSPMVSYILDGSSVLLIWLFFTGTYLLIPNTRVKFKNAFIAGVIAGTAFLILQWLFVSGQVYVTRYNAIYGSFAFLPLLLIWLQLVWLITLAGGVFCYASQNINEFAYFNKTSTISEEYRWRILLAVMTITVARFVKGIPPLNDREISLHYQLPLSMVTKSINSLVEENLLMRVALQPGDELYAVSPAVDPANFTLGEFIRRMGLHGASGFIPGFDHRFRKLNSAFDEVTESALIPADKILISSLSVSDLHQPSGSK